MLWNAPGPNQVGEVISSVAPASSSQIRANGHEVPEDENTDRSRGDDRERHPEPAGHAQGPGQVEELLGIVGGPLPGVDHPVVAGVLALDSHAVQGVPRERMEPKKAAGRLRDGLRQQVAPFVVHALVQEDRAKPRLGPLASRRG